MEETAKESHSKRFYTHGSLHVEINELYPKKKICEKCGSSPITHYALKHGHDYSLERSDYIELCPSCHKAYDHHNSSIVCQCNHTEKYSHGYAYEKIERPDKVIVTKICESETCNTKFTTSSKIKKYCCPACKVAGFRQKNGIVTRKEREHTHCQREGCNNEIGADRQSNSKYCSNACNQAVYNKKHAAELSAKRLKVRVAKAKAREKAKKRKELLLQEKKSKDLADEFLKELME